MKKVMSCIMLVILLTVVSKVIFNFNFVEATPATVYIRPDDSVTNGELYDWPMIGYDPACTCYSPSAAPNTNIIAWISSLPGGTTWAYPVVAEGKVFLGAGGYLNAFDEKSGGWLWGYRASEQPGYPCCTAVAEGRVYFGTGEPGPQGCIYALNATTGEQIWNYTTEQYVRAPIVAEGRLFFGVDTSDPNTGKIYCLNATTGLHLWNSTTQDKGISISVAYSKVYVGCGHWETSATGCVYCLNMSTGFPIWSFQTNRDITGSLSVANNKVYFSSSSEGADCVVFAINATNGQQVWSVTRYSNGEAARTAVAYGKVFASFGYSASGVYALNETDGDENWAFPISNGIGGGPIIADGKVFFARDYPSHTFYALNETNGTIVWTYELAGSVHSASSAIADEHVFVADNWDQKLYSFGEPYPGTQHNLTITTSGTGTTIPAPGTHLYPNGVVVSVRAEPETLLNHWELDGVNVGSTNPYCVLMDNNHTLNAVFSLGYNLTIIAMTGGTTNPPPGVHAYVAGTTIQVTAIPSTYYLFDHWELDGVNNSTNPISVLMNTSHTLYAVFTFSPPPGLPIVRFDPSGISVCPGQVFSVAVIIENVSRLSGLDLQIRWNTTCLQYINHTVTVPVEAYPSGVLHSPVFLIKNDVDLTGNMSDSAPGTMYWFAAASIPPTPSFNGTGTAFNMTFEALNHIGTTILGFTNIAIADDSGEPIPYASVDGVVQIVPPIHDVAITGLAFSEQSPHAHETIYIYVTVENHGNLAETFDVSVNCTLPFGQFLIGTQTITLKPGANKTLCFSWVSRGLGERAITTYTSPIPNDINSFDNTKTSYVIVTGGGPGRQALMT
jgi:outer membrane protein assembly factor BamB